MDAVTARLIDSIVKNAIEDYSHLDIEIRFEETDLGLTFEVFGEGNKSPAHQLIDSLKTNGITATVYYNNMLVVNETQKMDRSSLLILRPLTDPLRR